MITRNGKLTTWTDSPANLLLAAHDAVFGRHKDDFSEFISERHDISVTVDYGKVTTKSEELANLALKQGYWVNFDGFGGWEILFDWPKDAGNPPSNHALHA